jgi:hypothetical protein
MANGVHAAALVELEPSITPTKEKDDLELAIGEATADAVITIFAGVSDWSDGGRLSPATRTKAGDLFMQLYRLQEAAGGELAFRTIAFRAGARALRRRYGAALTEQCGVPATALDFEEVLGWPLEIVRKITNDERAFRAAAAH